MNRARTLVAFGLALILAASSLHASDLKTFQIGSWAEIRSAHAGRPYIVHLWGTTCAPCRVEMPEWGRLIAERPGVDIIFVHGERPPPDAQVIFDMLEDAKLGQADNWAFQDRAQAPLRRDVDASWRGELPMTVLVPAAGAPRIIVGSADMAEVRAWIAQHAGK